MDLSKLNLNDILDQISACKVKYDRNEAVNWLFEYGCQYLEYEHMRPSRYGNYLRLIMKMKAVVLWKSAEQINKQIDNEFTFEFCPLEQIPNIVRGDHRRN